MAEVSVLVKMVLQARGQEAEEVLLVVAVTVPKAGEAEGVEVRWLVEAEGWMMSTQRGALALR